MITITITIMIINLNDCRSVNCNLSICKLTRKKCRDFNGIQTCGICVSAAMFYQLAYKDPDMGSRPICWNHLNPWMEWNNKDEVNCGNTNLNEDMIVASLFEVKIFQNRKWADLLSNIWHCLGLRLFKSWTNNDVGKGKGVAMGALAPTPTHFN